MPADLRAELAGMLLAEIRQRLEASPVEERAGIWRMVAQAEKAQGNAAGAAAALAAARKETRQVSEGGPTPRAALWTALGHSHADLGDAAGARACFADAIASARRIRDARQCFFLLAQAAAGQAVTHDPAGASRTMALAQRLAPETAKSEDGWRERATLLALQGDFAGAKRAAARMTRDLSNRALALAFIAERQRQRGDRAGAEATLREALQVNNRVPDRGMREMNSSPLLEEMVRQGQADRALRLAGASEESRRPVAEALFEADQIERGKAASPAVTPALVYALARTGRIEEARTALSKVIAERGYFMQDDPIRLLGAIAAAQAKAGDTEAARRTIDEAKKAAAEDLIFGDKQTLLLAALLESLLTGGKRGW